MSTTHVNQPCLAVAHGAFLALDFTSLRFKVEGVLEGSNGPHEDPGPQEVRVEVS